MRYYFTIYFLLIFVQYGFNMAYISRFSKKEDRFENFVLSVILSILWPSTVGLSCVPDFPTKNFEIYKKGWRLIPNQKRRKV